jgi:hypothetical protein
MGICYIYLLFTRWRLQQGSRSGVDTNLWAPIIRPSLLSRLSIRLNANILVWETSRCTIPSQSQLNNSENSGIMS